MFAETPLDNHTVNKFAALLPFQPPQAAWSTTTIVTT
jgi:hypothetical protein